MEVDEGTPEVTWTYDQDLKGALSGVSITKGTAVYGTSYTHDGFGRTTGSVQSVNGTPYAFLYKYPLADRLEEITYPSGRVVKYVPDAAGRVSAVQSGAGANFASIAYTAEVQ